MNLKICSYLFVLILLLSSCGVTGSKINTKNFIPMNDLSQLNGRYFNKNKGGDYLSKIIIDNYGSHTKIVDIYSPSKDSLLISFSDTMGYNTVGIKGKMKDNYFEYYLEKKRFYLPPFYTIHWIEQRRIGKNKQGDLEVDQYSNHWGQLFCFIGGDWAHSKLSTFEPYYKSSSTELFRLETNGKWGYVNNNDSLIIVPQYDYGGEFENGLVKVSLNNKWGYIDSTNQIIIPIVYEQIKFPQDSLLRVKKDSKWGVVDLKNRIILPFDYDAIDPFGRKVLVNSLSQNLARVYKNNKIGFVNNKGEEVIPVIYDEINFSYNYNDEFTHHYSTKIGDKYGYITEHGVFCDPIFDKVDDYGLRSNHAYDDNDKIVNMIGKYVKVTFEGKPYIFGENGMIYPYKMKQAPILSLGKSPTLNVDFDNGIKVSK